MLKSFKRLAALLLAAMLVFGTVPAMNADAAPPAQGHSLMDGWKPCVGGLYFEPVCECNGITEKSCISGKGRHSLLQ